MPTIPFGSWPSPISAADATRAGIRFTDTVQVDGDDAYWVESRPDEGGRSVIVRRTGAGAVEDVVPARFNARTRVHEYGGGAYAVKNGVVLACSFEDQRVHRIVPGREPEPITPEPQVAAGMRFADLQWRESWVIAVRELHSPEGGEPINDLVRISLDDGTVATLAEGRDFYAAPRISPDGRELAWLAWDHPNMPWDSTELWRADLGPDGSVSGARPAAGGLEESIVQPEWSPNGQLYCVSDRTGFWNIYRVGEELEPVVTADRDFAVPPWVFGSRRYAFLDDGTIAAAHGTPSGDHLLVIAHDAVREVPVHHHSLGSTMAADGTGLVCVAARPDRFPEVVRIDTGSGDIEVLRAPDVPNWPEGIVSMPEPITFDTPDGPAHALFYPPANPEAAGPDNELPPLIVSVHGGPTSAIGSALDPEKLFWTSRGFGIVDVDYGGSTGYGREYRERLRGKWGIVDVRDCALAAAHLAEGGMADPERLLIRGGSAGGYTTLLALATREEFAAGASRYGVADLASLAEHTHKFEARYLDGLVGRYPEEAALYRDRSPITHIGSLDRPVILFQGSEDRVVPPEQSEMMRDALIDSGVPVAYLLFEGEGHGFRSAGARIATLEAELSFYAQVLGFEGADDIEAVEIENL